MLCLYPHGVLPCSCYVYTPTEYFLVHVMFIPPRSTCLFMLCLYPHGVLPCSCYVYTPTEYFLVHVMFIPPRSTSLFMLCLYPHGVLPCSCYALSTFCTFKILNITKSETHRYTEIATQHMCASQSRKCIFVV